nr:unnamed protein product [Digitaria exilis]
MAGTAAGAAAGVVSSASRRAAWQVPVHRTSTSATTRDMAGRLEVEDTAIETGEMVTNLYLSGSQDGIMGQWSSIVSHQLSCHWWFTKLPNHRSQDALVDV